MGGKNKGEVRGELGQIGGMGAGVPTMVCGLQLPREPYQSTTF